MIYLDYQATTPLAPEVTSNMRPWIVERFGNPHSPHRMGREAAAAIEVARQDVAALIGAGPEGKLHFTSGATESANWALKGAAALLPAGRRRLVTLAPEHAAVLDSMQWLQRFGYEVEVVPVQPSGLVDLDRLRSAIDERTGLVAAMLVNNEIGVVQPVREIGRLARDAGALFFCDAVQGAGRVDLPIDACDMVALSSHKIHGPKGVGALWVREGVSLDSFMHGGGQEGGLRSGTLAPSLCVGFAAAARLMIERRDEDAAHVEGLWAAARERMADWTLNGSEEQRYRGNLNIRRENVDSARLISEVRAVAFSAGSACASGSGRASHVLAALGLEGREARSSIRLGFGRYTEEQDLLEALDLIDGAAARQRSFAE